MIHVSPQARRFALDELCRRSGLNVEQGSRWFVEQDPSGHLSLVLRSSGSTNRRVAFPPAATQLRPDRVVRKSWPQPAPVTDHIADFIVPYSCLDSVAGQPLFLQSSEGDFTCTEDLLASIVLVLSRYEEIGSQQQDAHGRFPCSASIAARDGYLDRPIIDEYGLALQQVLQFLDPGFTPSPRQLRVKVSHDIDLIGIPFNFREPAVQILARRSVAAGVRDLLSGFSPVIPGSLLQVRQICELAQRRGLQSTLYWKASRSTPFDSGYQICDPRVRSIIDWAQSRGIEMGVHPGYETFNSPLELQAEIDRCRQVLGSGPLGGRQHYLRWSPESWAHWEQCGLAYDSSAGFAERAGFRAGTCWPYFPWLWNQNRRANLLEIPLIVMDRTLVASEYMGLTPEMSLRIVKDLMRRCEAVGGVITLLWHNNCLGSPYSRYYPAIFDALAGTPDYDWRDDLGAVAGTFPAVV